MDDITINDDDFIFRASITWFEEVLEQGFFVFPEKKADGTYRTKTVKGTIPQIHKAKYFLPYIGKNTSLTGTGWLPPTVSIHSIEGTISVGFKIINIKTGLSPEQMEQKVGEVYSFEEYDSWTAIKLEIPGFVLDRPCIPRARLEYSLITYKEFKNRCLPQ